MMRRKKLLIVGIVLLAASPAGTWYIRQSAQELSNSSRADGQTAENQQATETGESTIRLIASGDAIAHDSVNAWAKQANSQYDYAALIDNMRPFFDGADLRFCNQATPAGGEEFGISGYPVFNAPLAFTDGLAGIGCNIVNIGTNHTNDKGQPLINAAVAHWDKQKNVLAVAGANRSVEEQNRVRYFETKGVKFAFLSYVTYTNNRQLTAYGVNMWREDFVRSQLSEAQAQADIVIVSVRWGTEYSPEVNSDQRQKAQLLADLGVDIILGHGPHVVQPVERLMGSNNQETLVWYSLGNFLNSQIQTEALISGFAIMDIDTASKKIARISYLAIYMHYEWTAGEKRREDLLKRKNPAIYPLDQAVEALAHSQLNTTVEAQTARVRQVLNKITDVPIITSSQF